MNITLYPFHYRFLQKLFLLYVSIDENCHNECDQVIFSRFLQFFSEFLQRDLLLEMGEADFEAFFKNPDKKQALLELLIQLVSNQSIDLSPVTVSLFDDKVYTDPTELNLEIDELFKNLEVDAAIFKSNSSARRKSKKTFFD